jgi:hypothetical protein
MSLFNRIGIPALAIGAAIVLIATLLLSFDPSRVPSRDGVPMPFLMQVVLAGLAAAMFGGLILGLIVSIVQGFTEEFLEWRADRAWKHDYDRRPHERANEQATAKFQPPSERQRNIDKYGYDPDEDVE